jgi:hypothetical protein
MAMLTDKQQTRLDAVFASEEHVKVEATWGIYQRIVAAYREPNKKQGKQMMQVIINAVTSGLPAALVEIRRLGQTLKQRATDVLAYFDRPGTSNGPTEAINGRLEHLRGSALGFFELHQLHHPIAPGIRRLQASTTPLIRMNRLRDMSYGTARTRVSEVCCSPVPSALDWYAAVNSSSTWTAPLIRRSTSRSTASCSTSARN